MNCEEFEKGLEELEDYSEASPALQAHRRICPSCSELMEDLTFIRTQVHQMLSLEQPPDRVWRQIQEQLQEEGLIKTRPRRRFFDSPAFGWLPRLRMGLAYGSVFAVALGIVYVYSILAPPVAPPPLPQAPNPPFAQLFEKVPPEKRAIYVNNLNQVDDSIQQLQLFLASHPEDPFAREELFTTYQQKSRLWEDLVQWQGFPEEETVASVP